MPYLPIEDYGVIGNMRTTALVGKNGSIDWLCLPHFDSPSVFAAILDDEKGGSFQIAPPESADVSYRQFYWPDTNVLVSRLLSPQGVVEIQDFMPVAHAEESRAILFIQRSCAGSRWTAPCGWLPSGRSPPTNHDGEGSAIAFTKKLCNRVGIKSARRWHRPTAAIVSTVRC